ncbi:SURF1 family cytochrome oxidase biogenesis protein [Micromonospora sagamiensis]|uniref:SURF1-like protein n=1 Tax=Micromonospora sagamiensis TaxID=47875 RepID=A0A562WDG2_9ACTN|nr:SURF1 family protein [Micromonospora sagamiensis]TWJ27604.1 cytochrome oxidase assembly protein ShyY1 [Micromonospora sagamiensis]BCL13511.1 SURF1-like protein [Micromonospora sagamiensis]
MYRFLLTPRWLGYLVLALVAAAVMVQLGNWQLDRYQGRSAINERIDATARMTPVPLRDVLAAPTGAAGSTGAAPDAATVWTRVTVTGRYDATNSVWIRGRSVERQVGFELVTPLLLADGSAVLVDRGWVPPTPGGDATARPELPATPSGEVTVVGRVRLSESGAGGVERRDGRLETRRIGVPQLARELPYPLHGAYLLIDEQTPAADPVFEAVPVRHENNWQNFGYVVQWWLFAAMTLVAYGWVARREARRLAGVRRPSGDRVDGDGGRTGDDPTGARGDRAGEPTPTGSA